MEPNQDENFDSQNEEITEESTDTTEYVEQEDETEKLREQNKRLYERTKKAEAEAKALKAQSTTHINNDPQLSEELKLIARGLSDEEIEQAKVVARGRGIALTEAIKDPLFIVYQSDLKEQKRKEDAKLGASKGSGESQDTTVFKPNMTREEHMEAWKKDLV